MDDMNSMIVMHESRPIILFAAEVNNNNIVQRTDCMSDRERLLQHTYKQQPKTKSMKKQALFNMKDKKKYKGKLGNQCQ